MAKKAEEVTEEVKKVESVDRNKFIMRKLRAINEMEDKAKARALAERVLRMK